MFFVFPSTWCFIIGLEISLIRPEMTLFYKNWQKKEKSVSQFAPFFLLLENFGQFSKHECVSGFGAVIRNGCHQAVRDDSLNF